MLFGSLGDTGQNEPEAPKTLVEQQRHLVSGQRPAQMFPTGTQELPLPNGMARTQNERGVFHYNPALVAPEHIHALSANGRENEILALGPFSKPEIMSRVANGEAPGAITEYTPNGVEVRSAAGTDRTMASQKRFFDQTKQRGNTVVSGPLPARVESFGSLAPSNG